VQDGNERIAVVEQTLDDLVRVVDSDDQPSTALRVACGLRQPREEDLAVARGDPVQPVQL
jgi:hypothetical protein